MKKLCVYFFIQSNAIGVNETRYIKCHKTWKCDCECDKSGDVGEYLDYKNCKSRKRLNDKIVEEFIENIDGNKMIYNGTFNVIPLNDFEKICSSYTVCIILLVIFFTVCTSIRSVFIYFHWYLKRRYTETKNY